MTRTLDDVLRLKNFIQTILIGTFIVFTFQVNAEQKQSQEFTMTAEGVFEVKLEPQEDTKAPAGRMFIDKQYSGGLVGTGLGQMISKRTAGGDAVYSAIEEFQGSLDGVVGSFTLVHQGEISAEGQTLVVKILNGSGAGGLKNISGTLDIIQEEKMHKYVLNYAL